MKRVFTTFDIIAASIYREFLDAAITLKLAYIEAVINNKDTQQSLCNCAGILYNKYKHTQLKSMLRTIKQSSYPENGIITLNNKVTKLLKKVENALGTTVEVEEEYAETFIKNLQSFN